MDGYIFIRRHWWYIDHKMKNAGVKHDRSRLIKRWTWKEEWLRPAGIGGRAGDRGLTAGRSPFDVYADKPGWRPRTDNEPSSRERRGLCRSVYGDTAEGPPAKWILPKQPLMTATSTAGL